MNKVLHHLSSAEIFAFASFSCSWQQPSGCLREYQSEAWIRRRTLGCLRCACANSEIKHPVMVWRRNGDASTSTPTSETYVAPVSLHSFQSLSLRHSPIIVSSVASSFLVRSNWRLGRVDLCLSPPVVVVIVVVVVGDSSESVASGCEVPG